ncbi:MAG: hypothetical protein EX285_09280, partial [Thaumarchaeota archaeon]|nr:hypothetical protein [Nitrososphaerota archaeon]
KELERHFNDEFKDLMEDLNKLYNGLDKFVPTPQFFDKSVLYDEFKDEYSQCMDEYDKVYYNIIQNIESLKEAINNKKSKPFDVIEYDLSFMKGMFDSYKKLLDRITDIVGRHNVKTSTFNAKVKENREKLELHYVAYYVQKGKYFELKKKEANLIPEIDVLKQKRDSIINNISLLERKLSNETLGAEEFNKYLKEFLNRDEISLMYVEEEEGYKIVRSNNSDKAAEALSEGEKTAIAFVYFLVKLTENDEKVEDAIIVIDDPISSFDSNHLFHALSFMTRKCSNAKQLFILTHNFWFFKLVRDWLKKSENRDEKSSFYVIKNTYSEFGREAYLQNCDNSLIKYHSEYHYLFSTLLEYSEKDSLSFVDAYSLGNVCRRLLESFMSFKYPADRNLRKAMESSKYDSEKIERIYYYVQKFSHSDRIEAHENITDNVLGEGKNIITDVLEMIKGLDEVHYNQIIKVCKN